MTARYLQLADAEWLRRYYADYSAEQIARVLGCHPLRGAPAAMRACADLAAKPRRGPTGAQTKEVKRLRALAGEPGGGVAPTAAVASAEITRLRQQLNRR